MKMEAMGIPDEEEIIRSKREREERLKNGFSIEGFEQKYDLELKRRADKKRKMEEDKMYREKEQYTF